MSREHCELLFRCWEHNFRWFHALFEDYSSMSIGRSYVKYGVKAVLSYTVRQAEKLMDVCRDR